MENNSAAKYVISVLIILVFALGGYYFGKRTAETENMAADDNKPIVNPSKEETPTPQEDIAYELMSAYSTDTYSIYFRKDNTFRFRVLDENSGTDYVGTYEVKGNNITLITKAMFSTNGCYFKEGALAIEKEIFNEFTGTLKDNKLNINYMTYNAELNVDSKLTESAEDLKVFTVNPINTDNYSDCTNQKSI